MVAALPCTDCCSSARVPAPATGLMADSEHDEMYVDAEDSSDEQPATKTRKTASGRVLIHSKEGTNFQRLNTTYAVLLSVALLRPSPEAEEKERRRRRRRALRRGPDRRGCRPEGPVGRWRSGAVGQNVSGAAIRGLARCDQSEVNQYEHRLTACPSLPLP